jgi:flagellar basal body-associated protein FliL
MGGMDQNEMSTSVRKLLLGYGIALITAGVCLLLFFGYSAYQAFNAPQDVQIVQYVMNLLNVQEPLLKGHFIIQTPDGPQNASFQVEMAAQIKAIIFLFLGAVMFSIFVMIAKSVIKGALYEGDVVRKP